MCFDCHSIWICLVSYKIHNGDDTPKEKIPEVVKNFREFYTTQIFVTVFTNKPLLFLILIQNNLLHVSHTVSLRWFPILFPNLCFQVQPIFHIVQPKFWYTLLFCTICASFPLISFSEFACHNNTDEYFILCVYILSKL